MGERRAPVQGDIMFYSSESGSLRKRWVAKTGRDPMPAGSISWEEHEEAWREYTKRYGKGQSAERIAERHGFTYGELLLFLGRAPSSWKRVLLHRTR